MAVSMKLELSPKVLTALLTQAQAHGLSPEAYVEKLLREHIANPGKTRPQSRKSLAQLFTDSPLKGLDLEFERNPDMGRAAERAEAWRKSAQGLPRTAPLSDEAISRESIYGDHG